MSRLLRALTVLALLAAAVLLVALSAQNAGRVVITYGTYQAESSLVVAAAGLALVLGLFFYLGQLLSWVVALPKTIRQLAAGRHKQTALQILAEAHAAAFLGLTREANRAVSRITPTDDEAPLIQLLGIRLGTMPAATLVRLQTNPLLGAPASVELAHRAALSADWLAVKSATSQGLSLSPASPRLLLLHLKALLNLGETAAAADLLPSLKQHLTSSTAKKLDAAVRGGLSLESAVQLKSPWFTAFQQWLNSAAEQLPDG